MERLILEAMPNARKEALRNRGAMDPDDAIGIAYLTLAEVAPRFDPTRGVSFWQFARVRIAGAIRDAGRGNQALGNFRTTGKLEAVSLDSDEAPVIPVSDSIDLRLRAVDLERCVAKLRRGKQSYAVAKLLIAGWDDDTIKAFTRMNAGTYDATKAFVVRRLKEEIQRPRKQYRPWQGRIAEAARQSGVVASTVRDRMRRGVPIAEALKPHGVTINGVTLSIAVWARRAGLKPATVVQRIAKGVPPEQALAPAVPGGWGVTRKRVKSI